MSELILYQTEDGKAEVRLRAEEGSVWLTQGEIAELFATTKQNVSLHAANVLKEGELDEPSVVKESLTTATDGKNYRTKLYQWVEPPESFRIHKGQFVARVVGESMNKRIPNGAWCLFNLNPVGSRQGKMVLVQHRSIDDPDTGGCYTIKIYQSEKVVGVDGGWRHCRITLNPSSTDPQYKPIVFESDSDEELAVIAELVAVLG